jgi:hypothetical protein
MTKLVLLTRPKAPIPYRCMLFENNFQTLLLNKIKKYVECGVEWT